MGRRRRHLLGRLLAACALSLAAAGCSALLDFEECTQHVDCYASVGNDYVCSEEGYCVYQPLEARAFGCELPEGHVLDGDAIVFASLLTGVTAEDLEERTLGARLAFDTINLSGGLGDQHFALLECRPPSADGSSFQDTLNAAYHIRSTERIAAVIGAASSQFTLDLFQRVFQKAGILLVSPSATSPALSHLEDDDLVWRTAPSDLVQGTALAETAIHWDVRQTARVAFVARSDTYGEGLREAFTRSYCAGDQGRARCDESRYASASFDTSLANPAVDDAAATVRELNASLVVLACFHDEAVDLIHTVESAGLHPTWLLTDGPYDRNLPAHVPEVDGRLWGTKPNEYGPQYESFRSAYTSAYDAELTQEFVAHSYDAAFMLAYAAAAAGGGPALTGKRLAAGMARLSEGTEIAVGGNGWSEGVRELSRSSTATIDLVGAASNLDMDNELGEPSASVEGWRIVGGELLPVGEIVSDSGEWLANPAFAAELAP